MARRASALRAVVCPSLPVIRPIRHLERPHDIQCLYAGTGIMNFTPEFGWYYIDANDRSPSLLFPSYNVKIIMETTKIKF